MTLNLVHRPRDERRPTSMLHFRKCCCRFSLKTGSIAIGVLSATAALASLIGDLSWAYGAFGRTWAAGQIWAQKARVVGISEDYIDSTLQDEFSHMRFVSEFSGLFLLHLLGVVEAFHFNFSILLLFGIWKKRVSLLKIWVQVSIVAMGLRFLLILPIAVQALAADYILLGILGLVFSIVVMAVGVYFVLVVHNYHSQLRSQLLLKAYAGDWIDLR